MFRNKNVIVRGPLIKFQQISHKILSVCTILRDLKLSWIYKLERIDNIFESETHQIPVWKTLQIFLNYLFTQFQWEELLFSHWNLNKPYWSFCSFGRTWSSEISVKFSILHSNIGYFRSTKYWAELESTGNSFHAYANCQKVHFELYIFNLRPWLAIPNRKVVHLRY